MSGDTFLGDPVCPTPPPASTSHGQRAPTSSLHMDAAEPERGRSPPTCAHKGTVTGKRKSYPGKGPASLVPRNKPWRQDSSEFPRDISHAGVHFYN